MGAREPELTALLRREASSSSTKDLPTTKHTLKPCHTETAERRGATEKPGT